MSINIQNYYAKHEEGTKFYELTTIRGDGSSVLIQRWGAISKYGQTKVTRYASSNGAEKEMHSIKHAKEKRGYSFGGYNSDNCHTGDQATDFFRNSIGHRFDVTTFVDEARRLLHITPAGLGPDGTVDTRGASDGAGVIDAKPLPELKRDEKWGSW